MVGLIATLAIVLTTNVKEFHWDKDREELRVKIAEANKIGEQARTEAAKANARTAEAKLEQERLRADNLAVQATLRPRRLSFMGWTEHPEKVAAIYDNLKKYSGTVALIQTVPDFEAQMFARDIATVLQQAGWKPSFVNETQSHMSEMSFPEGIMIFTLSDGTSKTEAGTALWSAFIDVAHEMGGEPFDGAPIHEILDSPKRGYPQFVPATTAVFVRIGTKPITQQFLEIQRRSLERQRQDFRKVDERCVGTGRQDSNASISGRNFGRNEAGSRWQVDSCRPKQESENTRHEPDIDIAWRDAPRLTAAASRKIKTLHHR